MLYDIKYIKTPIVFEIMDKQNKQNIYNESFINLMEQLSNIMMKQGEPFRSRAISKGTRNDIINSWRHNINKTITGFAKYRCYNNG